MNVQNNNIFLVIMSVTLMGLDSSFGQNPWKTYIVIFSADVIGHCERH